LRAGCLVAALAEAASVGFGAAPQRATGPTPLPPPPPVKGVDVVAAAQALLARVLAVEQSLRDAAATMQASALQAALADAASFGYGAEGADVAGVDDVQAAKVKKKQKGHAERREKTTASETRVCPSLLSRKNAVAPPCASVSPSLRCFSFSSQKNKK
jgi:Mg-chelatase subunit ChlI